MTTREPGASEVLMWGGTVRPCWTAFCARSPAAIMTVGLEVLVQEVMAAMTMEPLLRLKGGFFVSEFIGSLEPQSGFSVWFISEDGSVESLDKFCVCAVATLEIFSEGFI